MWRKSTFNRMIAEADMTAQVTRETGLNILKTLAYFDIFDYPLSEKEIRNLLGCSVDDSTFDLAMSQLVFDKIIFAVDGFYALDNNTQKVQRRLDGNRRAQKLLPMAVRIGSFLYKFPYVRGVGISGSLSKNYADKKADIDFFIITHRNRLWIARTFLHLFKKTTFLLGRQHYYCMNYFVDEEALAIQERNIYTATEVITLLPAAGASVMKNFFKANDWSDKWYPAYVADNSFEIANRPSMLKKIAEGFFNGKIGDRIDDFLFHLTARRWKRKETLERRNSKGKIMNLVTGKHFSKSDPGAFQERIVGLYESRINELVDRWP